MIDPRTGHKYKSEYVERVSITRRPKKGEKTCSFCIQLKWEPDDNGGEMFHNGHLQKQESEVQLILAHQDDGAKRLALSAMSIHLGSGLSTQGLLLTHNQPYLPTAQLDYLQLDSHERGNLHAHRQKPHAI
jgi:hypothetical protein